MQTILDVSLLGQGFYHQKARTGVFRVAEALAKGLPNITKNLQINYADSLDLPATLRYISQQRENQQFPAFINDKKQLSNAKLQNKIIELFPESSIPQKAAKKICYQLFNQSLVLNNDMIGSQNIYHTPYFAVPAVIRAQKHIKQLVTIHDVIPVTHPHFFENRTDNVVHQVLASLQPNTFVSCVSEATKADLLTISTLSAEQIFINPLAASQQLFYVVDNPSIIQETLLNYNIDPTKPYLLSISTLEPRKNIDTVIKSFAQLMAQEKIDDLQLVLVGTKGWDFDKIFEAINLSEHLKDNIIFTGYIPDEDLAPLYSGTIGFVYASLCEGFGLPPLEAMQCGAPVITSNTSSLPEVVGDAGFLINPTDTQAISQAMLALYQNKENLRNQLRQKSLARAKKFSWDAFVMETYRIYTKIV